MAVKLFATGVIAAAATVGLALGGSTMSGIAAAEPPPAPAPPVPAPAQSAPLPTPDEVSGLLTRLTDPGVDYKEKGDLVENGIDSRDGHGLDHELHKDARDGALPYTFDVLNVVPAGPDQALANVTMSGPKMPPQTKPVTLVDQGSWVLTQESAKALFALLEQP